MNATTTAAFSPMELAAFVCSANHTEVDQDLIPERGETEQVSNKPILPAAGIFYLLGCILSLGAESKASAAKTRPDSVGIDATEIVGRYAINYAFIEKDTGTRRHNVGLLFEKDASSSLKLGIGLPVTYAEGEEDESAFGLGEAKLSAGWRFYHTPGFSALLSARLVLDTATDELLGDDANRVLGGLVGSWRKSKWLFSLAGSCTWSEDSQQNDVSLSPLLGYQPTAKYLSYITIGPSFTYGLETEEEALNVTAFMGKAMKNKDILALGTQFNVEGEDDNKTFLLLSWKRLF